MIPIKNLYYILCYANETLAVKNLVNMKCDKNDSLLNYIVKILIDVTYKVINQGLYMEYIEQEEVLKKVTGKIDVLNTIRGSQLKKGSAYCIYDELSTNTIVNRIIKTTYLKVYKILPRKCRERQQIENILSYLNEISPINVTKKIFNSLYLSALSRNYIILLDICKLLNENLVPTDISGEQRFIDFLRDEKKMANIFEKFVYNFYNLEQQAFHVKREIIKWDLNYNSDLAKKFLPEMKTDISLESKNRKIIIDTKYYTETLTKRFENANEKIRSSNLYQLSSYLYNVESKQPENINKTCEGILLYPTVDHVLNIEYKFRLHDLNIITLNLNEEWEKINKKLLDIIKI